MHQIVQLVPGVQPGHFYAWIVANGIMHKIPLEIQRVFYLNSKAPITEDFPGRRVKKILPHSKPNYNLIEVPIDFEIVLSAIPFLISLYYNRQ